MQDALIYGKNTIQNIVSLEVNGDKTTLFIENNGKVSTEILPNKFWMLSNASAGRNWIKLKGDLHFNYGYQSVDKDELNKAYYFLKKTGKDVYRIFDDKESFMVNKGVTYFKGLKHTDPSTLSFDIESTGLVQDKTSRALIISNTFRSNGQIIRKLFCYDEYETQGKMLDAWCDWVREVNPSFIIGHNIYTYDIPYLNHIAQMEGTELRLGRDGSAINIASNVSQFRIDGSRSQAYHKVRCYGREVIDTMFLAIKYDIASKKYESYGLKPIIKAEGLEKKDRTFYDASQIRFKYQDPTEWAKIKDYCKDDSDDSLALYDLMAPAFFYLTQSVPKSFQSMIESATGSQVNSMMVRSYLQDGHSIPKASNVIAFEGAVSFGNPGIYSNVFKVDIASLYPSIILQCDVYDEEKDPNGNFLKIIQTFTAERLKNKKLAKESKYHDDLQSAQKIVINSGYGFLGAPGLNFNSPAAAEFITKTGRDILNIALDWATAKGMKIVNADTDSISFTKSGEEEFTEEECDMLLADLNGQYPEKIRFEDDGLFKRVCVLKAKNYILYDGKKIKIKGSALKATTKSPALKEFIGKIIEYIIHTPGMQQEDILGIYNSYVNEISNIKDIKRWAARKTISDKVLNSERTNESKLRDAIEGTEIVEGDRCHVYYTPENELKLVQDFDGNYNKDRLYQNLYDTAWVFESVLDCDMLFTNYKLKKNKKLLEEMLTK